ncbi:MAG: acetyl-CoA acetyltransferase [Desulfatiglans sp.]|jgi:acetyl-CoA C-acetyltransferase|nr:acetyl-CoA acetyltransferase [Thermodesulfobacteriota bacterium]MEE4353370.1 acetyl-CoA acetyltransferase [Desulfatiglans sp.]
MAGIKDRVAILGMGCTEFGERWDSSAEDLLVEAFVECLEDAQIDKKEIKAAWLGSCFPSIHFGSTALPCSNTLKLPFIPVTRVENGCATGTEAFRGACYAVASGVCDFALAIGVEKLKDTGYGGLPARLIGGELMSVIGPNMTAPGMFAQLASGYEAKYKVPMEKLKEAMTHISWKSHENGSKNPRAHLRKPVTKEMIAKAPMIAYPLGLFDCCGVSDGAAAAIVTTPEIAASLKKNQDIVKVKALQIAASSGEEMGYTEYDNSSVWTSYNAGKRAYEEAGIKNPREEISMFDVHDCFSITEFSTYEDLQLSPRGKAVEDVLSGFYDLKGGGIPCQSDGGLKCFGHPIGASGLRMLYEMYNQLLGRWPEERQVPNPKFGLTHNLGGQPINNVVSVSIVGL